MVGDGMHTEAAEEEQDQREDDAGHATLAAGDRQHEAHHPVAQATAQPADEPTAVDDLTDVDVGAPVKPHGKPRPVRAVRTGWWS